MNYTPIHKAEFKRILNTIEWDGQTFAIREAAGDKHIFVNNVTELEALPTIIINHTRSKSIIQDTAYNLLTSTYRIRLLTKYADNTIVAEEALEELASSIVEKLSDFQFGDNSTWEQLMFTDGTEVQQYSDSYLYKDISVSVTNEVLRKNNYL